MLDYLNNERLDRLSCRIMLFIICTTLPTNRVTCEIGTSEHNFSYPIPFVRYFEEKSEAHRFVSNNKKNTTLNSYHIIRALQKTIFEL